MFICSERKEILKTADLNPNAKPFKPIHDCGYFSLLTRPHSPTISCLSNNRHLNSRLNVYAKPFIFSGRRGIGLNALAKPFIPFY